MFLSFEKLHALVEMGYRNDTFTAQKQQRKIDKWNTNRWIVIKQWFLKQVGDENSKVVGNPMNDILEIIIKLDLLLTAVFLCVCVGVWVHARFLHMCYVNKI